MNTLFPFALFQATVVFPKGASHGSFHASDGTIPSPPLNIAVARLERKTHFMTKQLEYGVTHRNTFTLSYTIVVHSQCGAVDCTQYTSGVS